MPVRVRLKKQLANKQGRQYINNLAISAKGTIVYSSQEYNQPSPLAKDITGGAVNGWEYIEVKKNDQWVRLDELRKTWRKTND
ncbi:MAG TPA: hypothetical protein DCL61_02065 [Cyanobacteria bacterium UBA12227]|nr:hypothetical protein [Cyanobacteria bacterium UBA12227]HAZ49122.1 hypothetical protein [Cyanobacteria bacterium UBA11371]HBE33072.1 hypothetical protein [Cyanobacteria bacterium UBA11368]HBE52259.1 hypothetical protein [Cyanobacteria bacterium UBA11369]